MAPKKKLIYVEDLYEAFCNTFYPDELRKMFVFGNDVHKVASFFGKKSKELIENAPAVDAVEVVRCKDCKHRADELDCGNYLCNRKMIGMVRPNDFCSFAERKTDG